VEQSLVDVRTLVVTVNGAPHAVPEGSHVADLLGRLSLDTRKVAVERNEAIVPRSLYTHTVLLAGDSLEIVHFIGGG
jgi:sulfur carrier protein